MRHPSTARIKNSEKYPRQSSFTLIYLRASAVIQRLPTLHN
jgi:hypothetical protein